MSTSQFGSSRLRQPLQLEVTEGVRAAVTLVEAGSVVAATEVERGEAAGSAAVA